MKRIHGSLFTWDEVKEALQDVLDDASVKVEYRAGQYTAYSSANDTTLDMGQVDARLAQYIGLDVSDLLDCQDRYVGYASEAGFLIVDQEAGQDRKPQEITVVVEDGMVSEVYITSPKEGAFASIVDTDTDDSDRAEDVEKELADLHERVEKGEMAQIY